MKRKNEIESQILDIPAVEAIGADYSYRLWSRVRFLVYNWMIETSRNKAGQILLSGMLCRHFEP